jgi:hypothetical protein
MLISDHRVTKCNIYYIYTFGKKALPTKISDYINYYMVIAALTK